MVPARIQHQLFGCLSRWISVSNELGPGSNLWAARLALHVVLVMAIIEGTSVGTVMILIRNVWGYATVDTDSS
ncbi:hypothetical protein VNO80_12132 [Phaseolus coccineus]|uniref:Uncharacterized protein n=1 Tax=Phaseolus coccineus TaxID=3886 RepID=A0AAN9NGG8_PHACN